MFKITYKTNLRNVVKLIINADYSIKEVRILNINFKILIKKGWIQFHFLQNEL